MYAAIFPRRNDISTHAPAGGATRKHYRQWCRNLFLLTPLREGRRREQEAARQKIYFYSRPCGRGDRSCPCPFCSRCRFLLTPLREGRLQPEAKYATSAVISTHAPAGGATVIFLPVAAVISISTHAPAGGATRVFPKSEKSHYISTHAPAGGATMEARRAEKEGVFLLTPLREGRRERLPRRYASRRRFLLTPLREGRPGLSRPR